MESVTSGRSSSAVELHPPGKCLGKGVSSNRPTDRPPFFPSRGSEARRYCSEEQREWPGHGASRAGMEQVGVFRWRPRCKCALALPAERFTTSKYLPHLDPDTDSLIRGGVWGVAHKKENLEIARAWHQQH